MRLVATLAVSAISATAVMFSGSPAVHAQNQQPQNNESKTVTVQPGDSLSKLANQHGSTYQRIFFANTEVQDPDIIYPEQKLRIPAANEQLAERPIPQDAPVVVAAPTTPVPAPAPVAAPAPTARTYSAPAPAPVVATGSVWDRLAQCESGGNWAINTGNGYYGGLQFSLSSWQAVGGSGLPSNASREEQIMRAERLLALQGWGAWPACSSKLGLR